MGLIKSKNIKVVVTGKCHFCGAEIELSDKVFLKDTCPKCKADLRACVQCRFYEPKAHHECREPTADFARDKEKRNSCAYFAFAGGSEQESNMDDARRKLEALFKKK